jgi:hypothetical protein
MSNVIRTAVRRHVAAATAVLSLANVCGADEPASIAFDIKATYLYKFAPYVEWPVGAFAGPDSPLYLCAVGRDPFGDILDRAVAGQRLGGHPIEVRRYDAIRTDPGCHILYVAGSPTQPVAATLAVVHDAPVLTVTDLPASSPAKGIVNFVIRDNHVRFEIDPERAAAHHLDISSKLLSLAVPPGR